jgi:hypothetical protein
MITLAVLIATMVLIEIGQYKRRLFITKHDNNKLLAREQINLDKVAWINCRIINGGLFEIEASTN